MIFLSLAEIIASRQAQLLACRVHELAISLLHPSSIGSPVLICCTTHPSPPIRVFFLSHAPSNCILTPSLCLKLPHRTYSLSLVESKVVNGDGTFLDKVPCYFANKLVVIQNLLEHL